jgi:signal transduction histidine kinase/CheY-like chemotaxis protein/methyl-accepting chemotaxis protein
MDMLAGLTTKLFNHPLQVTRAVLSADSGIVKMHRSMKDVALAANVDDIEVARKLVHQYETEVFEQFAIVKKWILGKEGADLIAETIQIFRDWAPIREEVITLMKKEQRNQASAITKGKGAKHVALLNSKMELLTNYAANKANGMYESAQLTCIRVITTTIVVLVIVIILTALLAFFISLSIGKSVRIINTVADKMVAGELAATVTNRAEFEKITTSKDEMGDIGRAFYAVANSFKTVIDDIVQVSQGLAKGNLRIMPKATYQGDFVQIKNALEIALPNQSQIIEDIIQVSQGLATGDLQITPKVEYKGDFVPVKNSLEKALSDLCWVIEDIVQVSHGLAEGGMNVIPKAEYRGDFTKIKNALESAAVKMAETTSKNMAQDWLKTGQTQLSEKMSGEQELAKLTKKVITFLATYLEMPIGMFYWYEEGDKKSRLKLVASYAYTHRQGIRNEFLMGEGLVGQAALEKQEIIITKVPDDYYVKIRSGLGKALPRTVIVQPLLYENTVKGVIELASFKPITDIQREFLAQIMPSIGIALNTAESRSRMQVLLEQSQKQAEELQMQAAELQAQQEELRQTNDELEERTTDLERQKEDIRQKNLVLEKTQTEMEKAKAAVETKAQELELASKYKSDFLANMSHELRTPLNSLLILAQLLTDNKDSNLTESQIEYAKTIHGAGSDLLTLINEVLDLSKVEAGKIEIHAEDVVLKDLVAIVDQKFRHVAEDKNIAFYLTLADNLPPVINTDGHRLKQIINNLLSNAFKFTTEGEIKLILRHLDSNDDDIISFRGFDTAKTIAISVIDTGIGIPKDKQQVIFEAFQQVDGGTSRRYGGTGLGLSISRQLAKLLGGELQLYSEEGKGCTFTLYLPKVMPIYTQVPTVSTSQPIGLEPKVGTNDIKSLGYIKNVNGKREIEISNDIVADNQVADDRNILTPEDKSILIVEDDRDFAKILMTLAREQNFKCLVAENGKTGLQFAEHYKPNAIILDVGLPQMDGWTVMEKLKNNPDTRHIPVHFMSASDQDMDAKKMGAIGYLLKPISMAELGEAFNKIEVFINKHSKNLLLMVDNEQRQQEILKIVDGEGVKITTVATIARATQELQVLQVDCIIIDVDVEQQSGLKIFEQLQHNDTLSQIPVIIYAERELTTPEKTILQQSANNLTIKAVSSPERLLDEATLFLHQVETNLPSDKQRMLQMVHNKEVILSHKKVLIVDDDIRNTFALTTFLEGKDMEVIVGDTGKEALEMLTEHPDTTIVLMDIMMPEMDGYEAIMEIRKQSRFRNLPIIAITAKAMKGDKTKCIEAGASDYIAKPVDTEKLLSLMRVWLYK